MTDQTPPRPVSTEPTDSPVPRAHCDREGCRAAFLPTKAWHRFCSKECSQANRNAARALDIPPRACALALCGKTFAPSKRSQTYCSPRCRQTAAITRRPAPTTPRDKLVRRLSDDGMVLAEQAEAHILAHPDHAARDVAAVLGLTLGAAVRILGYLTRSGRLVRKDGGYHPAGQATASRSTGGVTVVSDERTGTTVVTRPGLPSFSVVPSRYQATPERIAAEVARLSRAP